MSGLKCTREMRSWGMNAKLRSCVDCSLVALNASDDWVSAGDSRYTDVFILSASVFFFFFFLPGLSLPGVSCLCGPESTQFISDHAEVQDCIHYKLLAWTVLQAAGLINNTNGCEHGDVHHLYHTCYRLQVELKWSTLVPSSAPVNCSSLLWEIQMIAVIVSSSSF